MTIPILAAVPFLLPLIACAVSLEKPGRVLRKHIYKESFENSELNAWASYPPNQATAYDPMNGVSQPLSVTPAGDGALLKGILVRDWPVIIRLAPAEK